MEIANGSAQMLELPGHSSGPGKVVHGVIHGSSGEVWGERDGAGTKLERVDLSGKNHTRSYPKFSRAPMKCHLICMVNSIICAPGSQR